MIKRYLKARNRYMSLRLLEFDISVLILFVFARNMIGIWSWVAIFAIGFVLMPLLVLYANEKARKKGG